MTADTAPPALSLAAAHAGQRSAPPRPASHWRAPPRPSRRSHKGGEGAGPAAEGAGRWRLSPRRRRRPERWSGGGWSGMGRNAAPGGCGAPLQLPATIVQGGQEGGRWRLEGPFPACEERGGGAAVFSGFQPAGIIPALPCGSPFLLPPRRGRRWVAPEPLAVLRWPGLSCPSSGPPASALFRVLPPGSAPRRSSERSLSPRALGGRLRSPPCVGSGTGPRTVPRAVRSAPFGHREHGAHSREPPARGLVPRSCSPPESGPRTGAPPRVSAAQRSSST